MGVSGLCSTGQTKKFKCNVGDKDFGKFDLRMIFISIEKYRNFEFGSLFWEFSVRFATKSISLSYTSCSTGLRTGRTTSNAINFHLLYRFQPHFKFNEMMSFRSDPLTL